MTDPIHQTTFDAAVAAVLTAAAQFRGAGADSNQALGCAVDLWKFTRPLPPPTHSWPFSLMPGWEQINPAGSFCQDPVMAQMVREMTGQHRPDVSGPPPQQG